MGEAANDPALELARHIRSELSDPAPQGFHFTDHVARQDAALKRLEQQLSAHPNRAEVEQAVRAAIAQENSGWTLLKLLELVDRLSLTGAAPSLVALVEARRGSADGRERFLAGRACEVMLKLPLDVETRARANAVCQGPLAQVGQLRMGAERARLSHRPRRIEWALLVAFMALALLGLLYAFGVGR